MACRRWCSHGTTSSSPRALTTALYMDFEIPERVLGARGDWTHSALYVGNGMVVESLGSRGVIERDLMRLIRTNHHAMILRPRYRSTAEVDAAITEARQHLGKAYDSRFSLGSDERMYCIEHTYKSVTRGAPNLSMAPHSLLGFKFVTPMTFLKSPDTDIIYSTGSGFFRNYVGSVSIALTCHVAATPPPILTPGPRPP